MDGFIDVQKFSTYASPCLSLCINTTALIKSAFLRHLELSVFLKNGRYFVHYNNIELIRNKV